MTERGASAVTEVPWVAVSLDELGVFKPNRRAPIHRWVSFTEGFSAQLVAEELVTARVPSLVYDPFGGTGTTPLVAVQIGHTGYWAEVNPYLREVAATKVMAATATRSERETASRLLTEATLAGPAWDRLDEDHPLLVANQSREFFATEVARELVAWVARFDALKDELAGRIGRLITSSSAVGLSNMKRAVDLRRMTAAELMKHAPNTTATMRARLGEAGADLDAVPAATGSARLVSDDARSLPDVVGDVDLVVTSPPYLNGTNYCRNTKLELLLLRYLRAESELAEIRRKAVTAGINNVSKRVPVPELIDAVEPVALRLDNVAYDVRIPKMVRAYFADMKRVLLETRRVMRPGGRLVLDIGDSRFAGVHVDTPELLRSVAESVGWASVGTRILRVRVAKDGNPLCQKLLSFSAS